MVAVIIIAALVVVLPVWVFAYVLCKAASDEEERE